MTTLHIVSVVLGLLFIGVSIHNLYLTNQVNLANKLKTEYENLHDEQEAEILKIENEQSVREQIILRYEDRIVFYKSLLKEHGIQYTEDIDDAR